MKYWKLFSELPKEGDEIYILISDYTAHRVIPAKVFNGRFEYQCEIPDNLSQKFFFYAWSLKNDAVSEQDLCEEADLAIQEHGKAAHEALMTRLQSAGLALPT